MTAADICHLREDFLSEWRLDFADSPVPVLRGVGDLQQYDVLDSLARVSHVQDGLLGVEEHLEGLCDEFYRGLVLKRFLLRVLTVCQQDVGPQLRQVSRQLVECRQKRLCLLKQETCIIQTDTCPGHGSPGGEDLSKEDTAAADESSGVISRDNKTAGRFSSRINLRDRLSGKSTTCALSVNTKSNKDGGDDDDDDDKDEVSFGDAVSGEPDFESDEEEMFQRKKNREGEDELGHYSLCSKDNFLAVASKQNLPSPTDVPKPPPAAEAGGRSPNLPRHFQLLKMTNNFDLVLDSTSPASSSSNNNNHTTKGNPATQERAGHASPNGGRKGRASPINGRASPINGAMNRQGEVRSYSAIQLKQTSLRENECHTCTATLVAESHEGLSQSMAGVKESHDTRSLAPGGGSRPNSGELAEGIDVKGITRDTSRPSRKASVPPPIARKPGRQSYEKKLSPILVAGRADLPKNELRTETQFNQSPISKNAPVGSQESTRKSSESKIFNPADCGIHVTSIDFLSDPVACGVNKGSFLETRLGFDQKGQSSIISLASEPECPSSQSSRVAAEEDELSQVDVKEKVESGQDRDHSQVLSDEDPGVSEVSSALLEQVHGDMTSYDFTASLERRGTRVCEHFDPTEDRLRLLHQVLLKDEDRKEGENTALSSLTPPELPPRASRCKEKEEDTEMNEERETGRHKLSKSESSDTIVNEFDRKASLTSEEKDAIYYLDDALGQESADTFEDPPSSSVAELRKRVSSTGNYENWTINRALTMSLTQRDLDLISDDDELEAGSTSSVSPNLKRQGSVKGSKDSGLCDDISALETSPSEDQDLAGRQARDNRSGQQVDNSAEAEHHTGREESYPDKDMDDIWSRKRTAEPEHDKGNRLSVDRESLDAESVGSFGDDEASTTMDLSYDETDSARDGMLKMRELLVKGVLHSETSYLDVLNVITDYKRSLEACSMSSQPVIPRADIEIIFSDIENICQNQAEFVADLQPKVLNWHHDEQIGNTFKEMINKYMTLEHYVNNYQQAISTIHRCCQDSERFKNLVQHITINSTKKEVTSLEGVLFKPVQRVQRNTLVLHDLIKYTPQDHPDYESLQEALKVSQKVLESFDKTVPAPVTTQENRRLVKSSFLVELVSGVRKLRYIFLFSDVLICTKRETHRNNKLTFAVKWFIPLNGISIDTKFAYTDDTKFSKKDEIEELKNKLRTLKKEMRAEMRKYDDKDIQKHRSLGSMGTTAKVEKNRKKINQLEGQLILASPKLPFKVSPEGGKVSTILMSTEYEREEWKDTITSLSKKCSRADQQEPMNSLFIQELINGVKETPQVNKIGSVLIDNDEELLTGILNVTIHKVNGLTEACDTYCCLEMDSFGHFFMKARTHVCEASREPAWNEDFELELEWSQTLRILCFKKDPDNQGDKPLGRGALELNRHWLKGGLFQEKTMSMNEISLVISVRHTTADKTMQRTPSRSGSALFGVRLETALRREGKTVPILVTACVQEIERRGLDEVGIYRVSGVTSDLQRIKRLCDKNVRAAILTLPDADIHAVTGILKLYFRELPEPLFTENLYQRFIDVMKLQDEEAKAKIMLSLLHELPDANYYTVVYLLEHLIKVARNVGTNKMSIHNLSTVFGPTLLAPASKQTSNDPMVLMCMGAEQVMRQSGVLNYLLGLAISGKHFRRSAL